MRDPSAGVWEAVRRALGRLVSTVQVRDLPPARSAPSLNLRGEECLQPPSCPAGLAESTWPPQSQVRHLPPPSAAPGGAGADLAAVAAIVGMNEALTPDAMDVLSSPALTTATLVHSQDLGRIGPAALAAYDAPMTITAICVPTAARLAMPAVARLATEPPQLPKRPTVSPRLQRSPIAFPALRVREGLAVCAGAPLVRTRRPPPSGLRFAQAFAAERRQLAAATQIDLEDVVLLGIYPNVPVAAVRRLALDEDGSALSLWLKPEALQAAAQGRMPRFATLIIGRQRSSGRMIQTVA